MRWGSSKESLDDQLDDSKTEVAVPDMGWGTNTRGPQKGSERSKGPGDNNGRSGSYRDAQRGRGRTQDGGSTKPTKSPRAARRTREAELESAGGHGYNQPVRERAVDVEPTESTPREASSSRDTSRDGPQNNFSRRNSSRTRRGSKRRQHSSRGASGDRERDRERDRDRGRDRENDGDRDRHGHRDHSRERPHRERSSSRGRLGLDDSTTLDYVRGVPIDKDSRRKSGTKTSSQPRDGEGRTYDSDDSRNAHARKYGTPTSTSPSDTSRRPARHRSEHGTSGGFNNEAFEDDRALSPKMLPEDFLNSKAVRDAKNMNFTININAQPGSAVQIALGSGQNLPTPKPMITATPLKTEVRTDLTGMSDV